MADRRMFSKRVINSARFLKMPVSTQCLYFHLGLHADDDGVVEAYPIINSIGASEDDLRVLVAKNFVIVLNEELVTYITDWTENNKIRADRKIDSIYKPLLLQVVPNAQLQTPKERADVKKNKAMDDQWTSNGQPMDGIGKDRIGKVSIGKDSKETSRFTKPTLDELERYIQEKNLNVNAEQFLDYYESNGWKVGRNSMKDWKATVRGWDKRENDNRTNTPRGRSGKNEYGLHTGSNNRKDSREDSETDYIQRYAEEIEKRFNEPNPF